MTELDTIRDRLRRRQIRRAQAQSWALWATFLALSVLCADLVLQLLMGA